MADPGTFLDPSSWPLWMQSGSMGPIPGSPPAQQMPGQGLRDSVQPMVDQVMANRQKGIFDRLGEMFARRDEQGAPQAPGAWDYVNAALMALPGARGGRGGPAFAAEKGAGAGGVPAVSQRIWDAYKELGGGGDSVRLHNLRARLSDVPRAELDKTLLEMQKTGEANLMHLDNPRDIKAVGDAALKVGARNYHTLWLEAPSAAPTVPVQPPPPSAFSGGSSVAPGTAGYTSWLNDILKAEKGAGSGGPSTGAPLNAKALQDAAGNRNNFDSLLERYRTLQSSDLQAVAKDIMGYSPNGSKAQIIDAMKRWHRQFELNADRTAAQSKIRP